MAEYISREDILDIASQYCTDDDGSCSKADVDLREMLDEIEALPSADVQPVKHGRWSECYTDSRLYSGICSVCGGAAIRSVKGKPLDYCPDCGARMDLKDGERE